MIDMKQSAEEAQEQMEPKAADAPQYPYGLRLTLNDEDLVKLGITTLPAIGTVMTIGAQCEVCSSSSYKDQTGEAENSLSLQITAMEIGDAATSNSAAANGLYGGDND